MIIGCKITGFPGTFFMLEKEMPKQSPPHEQLFIVEKLPVGVEKIVSGLLYKGE